MITAADFTRFAGPQAQAHNVQDHADEPAADAADEAVPHVVVHVRRGLPASMRTALEAGGRGGLVLGTSLALGFGVKALVQGGLGMVDRQHREVTIAASSVGVGLSFLGIAPGVDAAVQGLQGLAGGEFSARTVRTLQLAGKAGALAACLAPAVEALWGEDELGRTLGTVVLVNNAAQVLNALAVEYLTGPVLGRGWMATTLRDARGQALQPGTAAFARQMTGSGALPRLLALALPSVLLHAGLAAGGNALMAPLAHAMGGPAAEELRFGQSSFGEHVIANGSVGLLVAAVETLRYFGTTLLQEGAHRLWGARLEPGAPAREPAPPAQQAAGNRLGLSEDACLRLFIYASFLNLTVAALVTGPQSSFVRWLTDDAQADSRLAVAQWLSLAANLMIATGDALVPMAAHHRQYRPARVEEIAGDEEIPAGPVGPVTRHAVHDEPGAD